MSAQGKKLVACVAHHLPRCILIAGAPGSCSFQILKVCERSSSYPLTVVSGNCFGVSILYLAYSNQCANHL